MKTSYLVISCSLNPESRSRILGNLAYEQLKKQTENVELIDLSEIALPLCDGGPSYSDPQVAPLAKKIEQAGGVLLATPIYNFDVNAASKNLIELTGQNAWNEKIILEMPLSTR